MKGSEIVFDTPRWFYSRRSTDWRMKVIMAEHLREFSFRIPGNVFFCLAYSGQFLVEKLPFPKFVKRMIVGFCIGMRRRILRFYSCKVLIAQGGLIPIPRDSAVIWETLFLGPQLREKNPEFKRGGKDYWIQCLEKQGPHVARIGVRGSYSVGLLKTMYPEFAEKVVDLGFVHPEYDIVGIDEVEEKQLGDGPVRLLFIGRLAKLKGLEPLLAALIGLRESGVTNFVITIVSTFRDGVVDLPHEGWVNYREEVDHEEAMRLFRKSQVFVMPTFRDSYGLVFHEAMASGCVTCVPDREPQREFVDNGRAGLVVNPYSKDDIMEKLRRVICDRDLRVKLALAGLKRYSERFSQDVVREAWRNVIDSVRREA